MKFPLSWLKEYIDISMSTEQIAKTLTMFGIEVDSIEKVRPPFEGIVIGKVLSVEKHPNADKLCVAKVTDGTNDYQVVCGAPNCREGLKTAFARSGAILKEPDGSEFKIKKTKLRGVDSEGMLCSAQELGLSDSHDGIIEFPESEQLGEELAKRYTDEIFEVSLTPNLNHCSSVFGIARELAVVTGASLKEPQVELDESGQSINKIANVKINELKDCPRYACRVIEDVTVGPSPEWLKNRLLACGLRSINNVVDVTNYVLFEYGHPLHAFDYDLLEGHQINVRHANDGEHFTTLDNKERILSKDMLLICDEKRPVALAGIMGGLNSEVGEKTKNILLESAYFRPGSIRKTSKKLGLQSDSSRRFERGADPKQVLKALDRATMLIAQLAGGRVAKEAIDVYEGDFSEKIINCRAKRINEILGTQLSLSEIETIFKRFGFAFTLDGQEIFVVQVPTYRVDITSEIDLIEEVARLYGVDNISKQARAFLGSPIPHVPIFIFEREVRNRMVAEGLQEFITCDLIGPELLSYIQEKPEVSGSTVVVLNPTSIEQSILRTSLLPGLLKVVKDNIAHQNFNIEGFEIGRIHDKKGEQYREQSMLGIILSGKRAPHHWDLKPGDVDFYDLKGIIENLLQEFGITHYLMKSIGLETLHSGRQASVFVDSLEIGSFGEVHPAILRRLDVTQRIYFAEFSLHDLFQVRKHVSKMKELPIYPGSERDWTITLQDTIPIEEILSMIRKVSSPLLEDVSLIDIYRSEKIGKDFKNATFRFIYRDRNKTVSLEEVDTEHQRLIKEAVHGIDKITNVM